LAQNSSIVRVASARGSVGERRGSAPAPGREDLRGRPLLDDLAAVHEDHPVGDLGRELDLVGHDQHRAALPGELAHDFEDLADQLRVERRGRLVEQHQLRLHGEHAGDRDPLLLAAREALGILGRLVGEAHLLEHRHRPLLGLGPGHAEHPARRHCHVVERGQVREQVEALEDEADLGTLAGEFAVAQMDISAVDLLLADQRAVDPDMARGRFLEIVDATQQRRPARAAGADDRELLAALDLDADPLQNLERTEALVQVDDPEQRGHAIPRFDSRRQRPDTLIALVPGRCPLSGGVGRAAARSSGRRSAPPSPWACRPRCAGSRPAAAA
jgi:hypothetical protein